MARRSNKDSSPLVTIPAGLLDRPLTARSVIASLLLGRHPPAAPAALLVRWCQLFGVTETAARVALTRMVQRGELDAPAGGAYALAGRIRARQVEQDFALDPRVLTWEGRWVLAVAHRGARKADERVALRRALERQRMVTLREGVWVRPDNLSPSGRSRLTQCSWWTAATPDSGGRDVTVDNILEMFGVSTRDERTRTLLDLLSGAVAELPQESALPHAFVTGAAVAQHLRRDPLLPRELLPTEWHADELRVAYREYLVVFGEAVATWAG